jgi:putative membrane protein insertion efficiency factor
MTFRRTLRALGTPARIAVVGSIRLYRASLAGLLGGQCRFTPTCSVYAEQAIRARGVTVGLALAVWRVLRCQPFGRAGVDPAPLAYDALIPRRSA